MRGAARAPGTSHKTISDFNPRSPCGERREKDLTLPIALRLFQSTLPMRGAAFVMYCVVTGKVIFQSTLPMRGAADLDNGADVDGWISIHAPHAGSGGKVPTVKRDGILFQSTLPMRGAARRLYLLHRFLLNFNPRSPCGERRQEQAATSLLFLFQSTLPMRGAAVSGEVRR